MRKSDALEMLQAAFTNNDMKATLDTLVEDAEIDENGATDAAAERLTDWIAEMLTDEED